MQARALLRAGDLAALHASDELSTMLAQGRSFQGWAEGPLTFPPTYKFIVGTLRYHGTALTSPLCSRPRTAICTMRLSQPLLSEKRVQAQIRRALSFSGAKLYDGGHLMCQAESIVACHLTRCVQPRQAMQRVCLFGNRMHVLTSRVSALRHELVGSASSTWKDRRA